MEPRLLWENKQEKMNAAKAAIMITIFFSMGQGKNHYTVSAINTFLLNLKKHHKIDIKRRWVFYCFAWLLDNKYIKRKQRYVHDHNGLVTQIPSMVTFSLKGVVWLVKMGVKGAKEVYKSMQQFLKKGDKRFPGKKDFDDGSWWPEDADQRASLEGLLGIATKKIS